MLLGGLTSSQEAPDYITVLAICPPSGPREAQFHCSGNLGLRAKGFWLPKETASGPNTWLAPRVHFIISALRFTKTHHCKLTPFFEVLVFQASILTMVAVSADRYQGVCHPLLTQSSNRRRRALLSIALVWGISLAASIVGGVADLGERTEAIKQVHLASSSPVLHIATYTELDLNGTVVCQCNFPVDSAWKNHYTTVITVGFFVLPLLALSVMYFAIGRRLIRPPAGETSAHLQAQHRSRRRVVLMLGTVVAVFFVCLLPHRLFQLWLLYAPTNQMEWLGLLGFVKLTIFMRMMVYINCSLNPIIYTLFSTRFRTAFFKCCSSSEGSDTFTSGQAGLLYTRFRTAFFKCCSSSEGSDTFTSGQEGLMEASFAWSPALLVLVRSPRSALVGGVADLGERTKAALQAKNAGTQKHCEGQKQRQQEYSTEPSPVRTSRFKYVTTLPRPTSLQRHFRDSLDSPDGISGDQER
ncbi:hypothetical protein Bbelb_332370 [Branchiostoma belcheri]|nr:hypothetical protein Bbelb_332370 [Branchiostoma belcheri]